MYPPTTRSFHTLSRTLFCLAASLFIIPAIAEENSKQVANDCNLSQQRDIAFTAPDAKDQLSVNIYGDSCNYAEVDIIITSAKNQIVYEYTGKLIELLPYKVYEPELNNLVSLFVDKMLAVANSRSTRFLPSYTNSEDYYDTTNDFVVIPAAEYETLRHQDVPIIWHPTGDSSWVHLVYDAKLQTSRVIMRGGVFH